MNLEASIDNILFCEYMQKQEQKKEKSDNESGRIKIHFGDFADHDKRKNRIKTYTFPKYTPDRFARIDFKGVYIYKTSLYIATQFKNNIKTCRFYLLH